MQKSGVERVSGGGVLDISVLFIVWVRPELTKRVFSQIRKAKPKRLYVAVDGPRDDRDKALIKETLDVIKVDWDCEVKYLIREKNLGCKYGVSGAITWFFENEEMGIILEDDCYPDLSFFPYCEELLNKYKDDTRIMTIGGRSGHNCYFQYSYGFRREFSCWGWASWRRAWKYFNVDMSDFELFKKEKAIDKYIIDRWDRFWWTKELGIYAPMNATSWAYVFFYNILCQNGLNITPYTNLVTNIGLGAEDSAHCTIKQEDKCIAQMELPLKHPHFIGVDPVYNNSNIFRFIKNYTPIKICRILSNLMPTKSLRHKVRYLVKY